MALRSLRAERRRWIVARRARPRCATATSLRSPARFPRAATARCPVDGNGDITRDDQTDRPCFCSGSMPLFSAICLRLEDAGAEEGRLHRPGLLGKSRAHGGTRHARRDIPRRWSLLGDPAYDANPIRLEPTVNWAMWRRQRPEWGWSPPLRRRSTTPSNCAERLLSFDHQSGGRAAWNVVTTRGVHAAAISACRTFRSVTIDMKRASEFLDVVMALWGSAATGRDIRFAGEFFSLEGRLRVPPSSRVGRSSSRRGDRPRARTRRTCGGGRLCGGADEASGDRALRLVKTIARSNGRSHPTTSKSFPASC